MVEENTSKELCKYFINATNLGEYCLNEQGCPYNKNFQKDCYLLGKSCNIHGKIPKIYITISSQLEKTAEMETSCN